MARITKPHFASTKSEANAIDDRIAELTAIRDSSTGAKRAEAAGFLDILNEEVRQRPVPADGGWRFLIPERGTKSGYAIRLITPSIGEAERYEPQSIGLWETAVFNLGDIVRHDEFPTKEQAVTYAIDRAKHYGVSIKANKKTIEEVSGGKVVGTMGFDMSRWGGVPHAAPAAKASIRKAHTKARAKPSARAGGMR